MAENVDETEPRAIWKPTRILRVVSPPLITSTTPLLVKTNAGEAFVKTLGNPEGPSGLIAEFVGTRLAAWLGYRRLNTPSSNFPPSSFQFLLRKGVRLLRAQRLRHGRRMDARGAALKTISSFSRTRKSLLA